MVKKHTESPTLSYLTEVEKDFALTYKSYKELQRPKNKLYIDRYNKLKVNLR